MDSEDKEKELIQQSISDLYKYKVVKVIASGMLVLHSESQQLYYIKVIHKTSRFSNEKLILPGNVPYMVKLYNYYNCENALFLVLQYCSGTKLCDYIKQKSANPEDILSESFCSNITFLTNTSSNRDEEESDCDSEHSYSDLIHDYTLNRADRVNSKVKLASLDTQNDENVVSDKTIDLVRDAETSCERKSDQLPANVTSEVNDLVVKSQELISSIDLTLHSPSTVNIISQPRVSKNNEAEQSESQNLKSTKSSRKSSERSEWSSFDEFQFNENCLLIQDVIKWAAQLLLALERLHLLGVICCDLQIKNLLIDETGDLVLTYMSCVTEKYDIAFSTTNDLTLAPEMHSFQPVTEAVDWWSFGAILYEMLVGMPLNSVHPEGLSAYTILKIPKYVAVEGRSLLKQLLAYEPHERLGCGINGAEDIKSHPFFNSVLWDVLSSKNKLQLI